jgi:predicted double-glycine peptidase
MPNVSRIPRTVAWLTATFLFAAQGATRLDVPYVRQSKEGCGSAAMSMVMRYWKDRGAAVHPESADPFIIQGQLHNRKAQGIYGADMARYLQSHGFRTFIITADFGDIERHLAKGRPLIACLNPKGGKAPLHFVVVIGLSEDGTRVLFHDPARGAGIPADRPWFSRSWIATGNWMLLAVPED